jgi:hypothetical protein
MATLSVDIDRLGRDIDNLARFTRGPGPGVTRLTFSEEDRAARAYLRERMEATGLRVVEFPPGVMLGRLEPRTAGGPAVMAGSHIDSVLQGGRFDGIVGVVGALIVFPYHLAAVAAGAGAVLGVIALFGGRKVLAGTGVVLCAAVIVFTVVGQGVAGPGLDPGPGGLAGETAAMQDVTVHDCAVVDRGDELVMAEATIEITNGTGERQSYNVALIVNDGSGARVAEINAIATDLAPGQSVVLSGANASGTATERAKTGPADCQVESVNRLALGG